MSLTTPYRLAAALMIGLVLGLVLGGLWSGNPLHAVATDRTDTFAIATGPVDDEIEAVYFLDFLTGELRAYVIGRQRAKFTAFFNRNVLADLGVDPSKNPKLMLVTGMSDFRRGASRMQPSRSRCPMHSNERPPRRRPINHLLAPVARDVLWPARPRLPKG